MAELLAIIWYYKRHTLTRYGRLNPCLLLGLDLIPSALRKFRVSISVVTDILVTLMIIFRMGSSKFFANHLRNAAIV